MKQNKIDNHDRRKKILAILGLLLTTGIIIGLAFAYARLRDICQEQCIVTDFARQVSITDGKMVRADVVAYEFGLKNGANLATIDFAAKRAEILRKIPNIRNIQIIRTLPDKVSISVEERIPIAKMNFLGNTQVTGRVVDTDGVVFVTQRGTQTLPTIREALRPGTPAGKRIEGRVLAALRLIERCTLKFPELAILAVDASRPDDLTATLASYSRVRIAWDGMEDPNDAMYESLDDRLEKLLAAINSDVASEIKLWNATQPGQVFADTQKGTL